MRYQTQRVAAVVVCLVTFVLTDFLDRILSRLWPEWGFLVALGIALTIGFVVERWFNKPAK